MQIINSIKEKIYSQNLVCVGTECPLACINCRFWQETAEEEKENIDIAALIKENKFFEIYRYKKWFNIVGGEALKNPDLKLILAYLKEKNIKNILWTNGLFQKQDFDDIKSLVDEIYIFIPSILKIKYFNFTGYELLNDVLANLDYLIGLKKKVIIHAPLKLDTIQEAPALHELARKKNVPLLFHYAKGEGFSRQSLENIWRYKRIKGVYVKEVKEYPANFCAVYPNLHTGLKKI